MNPRTKKLIIWAIIISAVLGIIAGIFLPVMSKAPL